jgi:hypothetical protein
MVPHLQRACARPAFALERGSAFLPIDMHLRNLDNNQQIPKSCFTEASWCFKHWPQHSRFVAHRVTLYPRHRRRKKKAELSSCALYTWSTRLYDKSIDAAYWVRFSRAFIVDVFRRTPLWRLEGRRSLGLSLSST